MNRIVNGAGENEDADEEHYSLRRVLTLRLTKRNSLPGRVRALDGHAGEEPIDDGGKRLNQKVDDDAITQQHTVMVNVTHVRKNEQCELQGEYDR